MSLKEIIDALEVGTEHARTRNALVSFLVFGGIRELKNKLAFLKTQDPETYGYITGDLQRSLSDIYTYQRIWKALYFKAKTRCHWATAARKFDIDEDELRYVYDALNAQERNRVKVECQFNIILEPLSDKMFNGIIDDLSKHAWRVAQKKLRFIAMYDPGQTLEDLACELLSHGVAVVRNYDYFAKDGKHDVLKITNYARRTMSNCAINAIYHNTHPSRNRLRNVSDQVERICANCGSAMPPKVSRCECGGTARSLNNMNEFECTTLSLDVEYGSSMMPSFGASPYESTETAGLLRFVGSLLDEQELKFLSLLLDPNDEAFEAWLWTEHHRDVDTITAKDLQFYAAMYHEIDVKETMATLRDAFKTAMRDS